MDLLTLTAHLPEVELSTGEILVAEDGDGHAIWVLESGALEVRTGEVTVNTISGPAALVGEVSVLPGIPLTATVRNTERSRLRFAADGRALLDGDPAVARLVAMGLASRLNVVTAYLADLKRRYGDAPGLAMVNEVLAQRSQRQAPAALPGSARDPEPDVHDVPARPACSKPNSIACTSTNGRAAPATCCDVAANSACT